uniref:tRNA (guanine(46)-N(7))-methyltransferase n=2 Tax=Chrysotila carterae TaxID=13221 RepID=A0A7S4F6X9_CHRCT
MSKAKLVSKRSIGAADADGGVGSESFPSRTAADSSVIIDDGGGFLRGQGGNGHANGGGVGWPIVGQRDGDPQGAKARTEELTREIATYARAKQLRKSVDTFQQLISEGLRPNGYTYSNMINAFVNSGDVAGATRMLSEMVDSGFKPNVVVHTTILKGLCAAAEMPAAIAHLQRMGNAVPSVCPDIRTLNTFLRGCVRSGDLLALRWAFTQLPRWGLTADHTAHSARAKLLSQGLQLKELETLVRERRHAIEAEAAAVAVAMDAAKRGDPLPPPPRAPPPCSFWLAGACERGVNCKFYHDLAVPQRDACKVEAERRDALLAQEVHTAHAAAMLGRIKPCRRALKRAARLVKDAAAAEASANGGEWNTNGDDISSGFRRSELEREAQRIQEFVTSASGATPRLVAPLCRTLLFGSKVLVGDLDSCNAAPPPPPQQQQQQEQRGASPSRQEQHTEQGSALASAYTASAPSSRLSAPPPPPPGGAPRALSCARDSLCEMLLTALRRTLGLDAAISRQRRACGEKGANSSPSAAAAVAAASLAHCRSTLLKMFSKDCRLRWNRVFQHPVTCHAEATKAPKPSKAKSASAAAPDSASLPIKLEVASGTGDWVAAQALADVGNANWIAAEIRHDRVCAIFSRMVMRAVPNLCVVGGDATDLLRSHVKPQSISHIFVNFPEPPHRSGDEDASNERALLTDEFFRLAHKALTHAGRITIFSDNRRYCQSLARSIGSLRKERLDHEKVLVSEDTSIKMTTATATTATANAATSGSQKTPRLFRSVDMSTQMPFEEFAGVRVYLGVPGREGGHLVNETSYFDRFWEHGQHVERCFLLLSRE